MITKDIATVIGPAEIGEEGRRSRRRGRGGRGMEIIATNRGLMKTKEKKKEKERSGEINIRNS